MREIVKKLKISYDAVYYSLHRTAQTGSNQNKKRSEKPWCTTEQEYNYLRVFSLRNRCLTSPQLAASLNSTRKAPVSTSTVKRWLRDAGLLGSIPEGTCFHSATRALVRSGTDVGRLGLGERETWKNSEEWKWKMKLENMSVRKDGEREWAIFTSSAWTQCKWEKPLWME